MYKKLSLILAAVAWLAQSAAAADVSYLLHGRVLSFYEAQDAVQADSRLSVPGVIPGGTALADPSSNLFPLPGVTIEVYLLRDGSSLGIGYANREGFYNVAYSAPPEAHEIRFLVFQDFADGNRDFIAELVESPDGDPIEIAAGPRTVLLDLYVPTGHVVHGGGTLPPSSEFLFTEVGDVDVDDILDEQQDGCDPATECGVTKETAEADLYSPPRKLGPGFAFGSNLELYALFGQASHVRYYRIRYSGPVSGTIRDPLKKKNYVLTGGRVKVFKVDLGPKDVLSLTDVYELDERMVGSPVPGEPPGTVYSEFWTEQGQRALWKTGSLPDGKYTLEIEAWDAFGNPVAASTHPFADLNLHLVNTPPEATIHEIQYLNGDPVLTGTEECPTVLLNRVSSPTFDDSLQFMITATHADTSFLGSYALDAWFGNNKYFGRIAEGSSPVMDFKVPTPTALSYQSCSYRFRLRVVPKITNGYHVVYERHDNWSVAIHVQE